MRVLKVMLDDGRIAVCPLIDSPSLVTHADLAWMTREEWNALPIRAVGPPLSLALAFEPVRPELPEHV